MRARRFLVGLGKVRILEKFEFLGGICLFTKNKFQKWFKKSKVKYLTY